MRLQCPGFKGDIYAEAVQMPMGEHSVHHIALSVPIVSLRIAYKDHLSKINMHDTG